MGKSCCVSNCRSGSYTCGEIVSVFQAPKDSELFSKWKEALSGALKRTFTEKDVVCAKHFQESDIVRTWTAVDNKTKEVAMTVKLKKPRLKAGTIPSIFPNCPQKLTKEIPVQGKRPLDTSELAISISKENAQTSSKQDEVLHEDVPDKGGFSILGSASEPSSVVLDGVLYVKMDDNGEFSMVDGSNATSSIVQDIALHDEIPDNAGLPIVDNSKETFKLIWDEYHIELPSLSWAVHRVEHLGTPSFIVISSLGVYLNAPKQLKQISMDTNCNLQYMYINKRIESEILKNFPNLPQKIFFPSELQDAIHAFDKVFACSGGPCMQEFPNVYPQCANHDVLGKWRHIDCPLLLKNKSYSCRKCDQLRRTLGTSKARNKRPLKRLRLNVNTPLTSKMFQDLKKARHLQASALSKARNKITTLKSSLQVLQKKYLHLSQGKTNMLNLPEAQVNIEQDLLV